MVLIPLHNASSFGHADVVRLLISHGANPNVRDNWNFTPLHEACDKGKVDVCIGTCSYVEVWVKSVQYHTALLQNGADPNSRNNDGKTAIDLADPLAKQVLTGRQVVLNE